MLIFLGKTDPLYFGFKENVSNKHVEKLAVLLSNRILILDSKLFDVKISSAAK
jgi:hypothetical protein